MTVMSNKISKHLTVEETCTSVYKYPFKTPSSNFEESEKNTIIFSPGNSIWEINFLTHILGCDCGPTHDLLSVDLSRATFLNHWVPS
jgi:hypothetical protein